MDVLASDATQQSNMSRPATLCLVAQLVVWPATQLCCQACHTDLSLAISTEDTDKALARYHTAHNKATRNKAASASVTQVWTEEVIRDEAAACNEMVRNEASAEPGVMVLKRK